MVISITYVCLAILLFGAAFHFYWGVIAHNIGVPSINRYLKISLLWIGVPSTWGLLLAFAGAGPGGAGAIFLFFGFFVGLIGAPIHCLVLSIKNKSIKAQMFFSISLLIVASYFIWLRFTPPTCNYTEEQALERVHKHVIWLKRSIDGLGAVKFKREDCSYSYTYEGPEGKFEHVVSNWGEVHTWDYSQGEL